MMMNNFLDNESQRANDYFWNSSGFTPSFPVEIERCIAICLPVAIIRLPKLSLRYIERWLNNHNVSFSFNCNNRLIRGCLLAFKGSGLIFVDGSDPLNEIRFSIAHETAHFLIDYWFPRQKAKKFFGNNILDVLDGFRPPEINENLSSLLSYIPIGYHKDVIERENQNDEQAFRTWKIESRADRLAYSLLAPQREVMKGISLDHPNYETRKYNLSERLISQFDLPVDAAGEYADA